MTALPLSYARTGRRKPRTAPSFIAAATAQGNGVTSLSVTIPATSAIGDFALTFVTAQNGFVVTPPAGFTLLTKITDDRPSSSSANSLYVFYSTLLSGAPGANSGNFTFSSSDAAIAMVIYRNVGGISVQPVWNINDATIAAGFTHRNPETKPGPFDRVISAITAYTTLSTGSTHADPSAIPSGFTQRANAKGGNSGLVKPRAITVADGPSGDMTGKTWSFANACYTGMVSLCLRPLEESLADVEKLPPGLAGLPVYAYGASYHNHVLGGSSASTHSEHITDAIMFRRALRLTSAQAASKNFSMGGSFAADQCSLAFGTAAEKTEFDPTDAVHVNTRVETWLSQTLAGLVLWDGFGNDAFHDQDSSGADAALRRLGALNSLHAMVRLFRASAAAYIGNPVFNYTSTWSAPTSTGFLGGIAAQTTIPGATQYYSANADHGLVLTGFDDASIGGVGAAYEIRKGGTLLPVSTFNPGTTSSRMKASGTRQNYKFAQMVVPIEGVNPAGETIELKHVGSNGHVLQSQGTLIPSATPPVVVLNKLARINKTTFDALYGGAINYTDATFDTYSALVDQVAAQFTDGRVLAYDPIASGRFDTSTMIGFDAVHINGAGHAHYWHEILRMLNERFS